MSMKKVLFVTDGLVHPPFTARNVLRKTLEELDGFAFQHVHSMEELPASPLDYSALVLYFHHKKISETALAIFDEFVSNGGGVVGVHSATAAFQQQRHYFEILGGRFVGHGPVEYFEIVPVTDSDIFGSIPAFTIRDELYIHELEPGIETHFSAKLEGKEIPVVWTYRYSKGKVCYAVPGHTTRSLKHPSVQAILQRGLMWVTE